MIITIDGPTASGKSSLANLVANKLGLNHLNSGLLFRAVAYILINYFDYNQGSLTKVKEEDVDNIFAKKLEYVFKDGSSKIIYDSRDITSFLKSQEIDQAASILSTVKCVREKLLNYQRSYSKLFSIVVDGRDVGSVVFPEADFKVFLTAEPEIRAERWRQAQLKKAKKFTFEQALKEISIRDKRDRERVIAPLIIPEGASIIDNTNLNLQETLDEIFKLIKNFNLFTDA
jgi:CMP/dCMP kinase